MYLSLGDRGIAVWRLQDSLRRLGLRDQNGRLLNADGIWGPLTDYVVGAFQTTHTDASGEPLAVDHVAGPLTLAAVAVALLALTSQPVTVTPAGGDFGKAILAVGLHMHAIGVRETGSSNQGPAPPGGALYESVTCMLRVWGSGANPWCAAFASMCVAVAYLKTHARAITEASIRNVRAIGLLPENPLYVPSWTTHARARRWIVSGEPKPGDLFCISGDHTGLVEESRGATIVTCEGNCSNAVASIIRATHGAITHYIRPRA